MEYRWFAVQTTAGHENKVRTLLQKRIEEDPRAADQKLVRQALVPVQEAIEIKNGKKVVVERKLYPGYVLIETTMSQEAQHLVNSVQGVIKFVGTGKLPQPLRQEEVNRLLGVVESYPELRSSDTVLRLMDELAGTENRIAVERRRYNDRVRMYNTLVQQFPAALVASAAGFRLRPYFEAGPEAGTPPAVTLPSR